MVLFPLAVIWLAVVLFFVLRASRNDAEQPGAGGGWTRWRPPSRTPRGRGPRRDSGGRVARARARAR